MGRWWCVLFPPAAVRPRVTVGGEDLGRVGPGVTEHHRKHCDTDGACPLHDPTEHHMRGWPVFHGEPFG